MAQLLRTHKQRATAATLPGTAKPTKHQHFASQNTIASPGLRCKFTPSYMKRKPIGMASADRTAFPRQLQMHHMRRKSTATMVETTSQLTQKDALKEHFRTYQDDHLPAQILGLGAKHEKKRSICRQMSRVVTDFSGRTVHDRAKTQSRFNHSRAMISRARTRALFQRPLDETTRVQFSGTLDNYGARTVSNVVSESSFGRTGGFPVSDLGSKASLERVATVPKPAQYRSKAMRPKEIVRVYSKTEQTGLCGGDGIKMSPGFFTQYFDDVGELKALQEATGLLIKISGIQRFVLDDKNFMKSNLQKTSFLDAFNSHVDLGPTVVCHANVGDFNADPRHDEDTDTLALPEWAFERLKIKPGEPVSVTYDTSLADRKFTEFVAAIELQPLQKNYDEAVSAQEVMDLIREQKGDLQRRTDEENIDSATEAVQRKVEGHVERHRVVELNQIMVVRNGAKRFEFKVSRLINQYSEEILSTLGLADPSQPPAVILDLEHLELTSEGEKPRERYCEHIDGTLSRSGTHHGERRVSKLDLDLILKREGLNLFHMQAMLDEHRKTMAQTLPTETRKSPKRASKSAGAGTINPRRKMTREQRAPSQEHMPTPSGSLSIIDEKDNSGLNQALELQSLVANQAVDLHSNRAGRNRDHAQTAVDKSNEAILLRNLARAPNQDQDAVSLRDRYHLRGHVQLNYVMLGDTDVDNLAEDEAFLRQSAEAAARLRGDTMAFSVNPSGESAAPLPPMLHQTQHTEQDSEELMPTMADEARARQRLTAAAPHGQPLHSRNEDLLLRSLKHHPMALIMESPERTVGDQSVIISPEPEAITKPRLAPFSLQHLEMTPTGVDAAIAAMPDSTTTAAAPKNDEKAPVTLDRTNTAGNSRHAFQFPEDVKSPPGIVEPLVEKIRTSQKGPALARAVAQQTAGLASLGDPQRDSLQVARHTSATQEHVLRDQIIATIRHSQDKAPSFGNPDIRNDLYQLLTQRQDQKLPVGADLHSTISPRTLAVPGEISMHEGVDMTAHDGTSPLMRPFNTLGAAAKKQESIETITAIPQQSQRSRRDFRVRQSFAQQTQRRSQNRDNIVTEQSNMGMTTSKMQEVVLRPSIHAGPGMHGSISFRTKALQKLNNAQSLFYNSQTLFGIKTPIRERFRPKHRQMNLDTEIFWGKPSEAPDKQVVKMPSGSRPDPFLDLEPHTLSLTLLAESRRNKTLIEDMLGDIDMNKISLDNLKAMLELCVQLQDKFNARLIPQHVANFFQIELINLLLQHKSNSSNFANYNTTRHLRDLQAVLRKQAELRRSSQFSEGMRQKRAMSAEEKSEDSKGHGAKPPRSGHRTHSTLAKDPKSSSMTKPGGFVSTSLEVGRRVNDYDAVDRAIEKKRHSNSIQRSVTQDSVDQQTPQYKRPQTKPRPPGKYTSQASQLLGEGNVPHAQSNLPSAKKASTGHVTQAALSPDSGQADYLSAQHGLTPKIKPSQKDIIQLHQKVKASRAPAQATLPINITHRTSRTRQDADGGSKFEQPQSHEARDGLLCPSLALNEDLANGRTRLGDARHSEVSHISDGRPSVEMKAVLKSKRGAPFMPNQSKKRAQSKQFLTRPVKLMEIPFDDDLGKQHESPHRQPDMRGYFQTLAQRLGTRQNMAVALKTRKPQKRVQAMATQTQTINQEQNELSRQFFRQFALSDASMPPLASGDIGAVDLMQSECRTPPLALDERLGGIHTATMRPVSKQGTRNAARTPGSTIPSNVATGFAALPPNPQMWRESKLTHVMSRSESAEQRQQQRSVIFEGLKRILSRPLEVVTSKSFARSRSASRNSQPSGMARLVKKGESVAAVRQPMSAMARNERRLQERVVEIVAQPERRGQSRNAFNTGFVSSKSMQKIAQEGELNSCAAKHPRI